MVLSFLRSRLLCCRHWRLRGWWLLSESEAKHGLGLLLSKFLLCSVQNCCCGKCGVWQGTSEGGCRCYNLPVWWSTGRSQPPFQKGLHTSPSSHTRWTGQWWWSCQILEIRRRQCSQGGHHMVLEEQLSNSNSVLGSRRTMKTTARKHSTTTLSNNSNTQ